MNKKQPHNQADVSGEKVSAMRFSRQKIVKIFGAVCLVLCVLTVISPSFANPTPLEFGPSSGNWVTVNQYDERLQNPPKEELTKDSSADQGFTSALFEQEKQRRASPQRPLDLPNMPSASTNWREDEKTGKNVPFLLDELVQLPSEDGKKIWVHVDDLKNRENDKKWADVLYHPLSKQNPVRLSVLPSSSVKPLPAQRLSRPRGATPEESSSSLDLEKQRVKEAESKRNEQAKDKKVKIPAQMCDELNEYRRRQLEAMETDRNTLAALKKALSEVGLTEREGYITEGKGEPKSAEGTNNIAAAKDSSIQK
jgi:hypothetical protein